VIVCRNCGSHNADGDAFCGSCGNYLEWTGEKLESASAKLAVATPEPQPTPEQPAPEQPAAAALVAPAPEVTPDLQDRPAPSTPTSSGPRERKPQPEPLPPQPVRLRRQKVPVAPAPPTLPPQPDDLICGDCGEGNPPTRRFCSRCGASLHTAAVVPTPWWRKLLRLLSPRRVRPAGSRPRRRPGLGLRPIRGLFAALRRALIVALVLAGLLYAIVPPLRGAVNERALAAKDRVGSLIFTQYVPVRPTSVAATGELPDHPAGAATDGFRNTFWTAPDAAAEPTLVLGFDRPTDLVRAIVHNGGGEDFQALGRPQQLHLVYSTGQTADVTLSDTPEQQEVEFDGGSGATSVEIHVVSIYRSVQSPGLALSEIELFERQ